MTVKAVNITKQESVRVSAAEDTASRLANEKRLQAIKAEAEEARLQSEDRRQKAIASALVIGRRYADILKAYRAESDRLMRSRIVNSSQVVDLERQFVADQATYKCSPIVWSQDGSPVVWLTGPTVASYLAVLDPKNLSVTVVRVSRVEPDGYLIVETDQPRASVPRAGLVVSRGLSMAGECDFGEIRRLIGEKVVPDRGLRFGTDPK